METAGLHQPNHPTRHPKPPKNVIWSQNKKDRRQKKKVFERDRQQIAPLKPSWLADWLRVMCKRIADLVISCK